MNGYVLLQQALVTARQDALRTEADTTRLLSSARPLPAVSAGGRATGTNRPVGAAGSVAVTPRSLGAAAAADRPAAITSIARSAPARSAAGCSDAECATGVAPAA